MANNLSVTPQARLAAAVVIIEALLLVIYCIALAVAGFNSEGVRTSAPVAEIAIYLLFAIGIGLVARATLRGSSSARPPYFLTQIFVIIVGLTVFAGDGTGVKIVGIAIAVLGLVGLVVGGAAIRSQETSNSSGPPGPPDSEPLNEL